MAQFGKNKIIEGVKDHGRGWRRLIILTPVAVLCLIVSHLLVYNYGANGRTVWAGPAITGKDEISCEILQSRALFAFELTKILQKTNHEWIATHKILSSNGFYFQGVGQEKTKNYLVYTEGPIRRCGSSLFDLRYMNVVQTVRFSLDRDFQLAVLQ